MSVAFVFPKWNGRALRFEWCV